MYGEDKLICINTVTMSLPGGEAYLYTLELVRFNQALITLL